MEIKNEDHARKMIENWRQQPALAQKREIRIAIEHLELSLMYYEQKDNERGMVRSRRCIEIISAYLKSIE